MSMLLSHHSMEAEKASKRVVEDKKTATLPKKETVEAKEPKKTTKKK